MERLSSDGGVCFAPVYSNGTGDSHLYAVAMDKCCDGGTTPVQLGPKGNAPWSDDEEILCGRQCVQASEWPDNATERYKEMRRFSTCMEVFGVRDLGQEGNPVKCEIDDDLLWEGWDEGRPPKGAENLSDDDKYVDNDNDNGGGTSGRANITGDGKTCPGPRRTIDEVFGFDSDEDADPELGVRPDKPYCAIAVPKHDPDWAIDVFKGCCEEDLGSFPPWPDEVDDFNCQRLCQLEWSRDQDETAQLEAVRELNKCFLKPSWSKDNGRRPFIACYGLGNFTLESADPQGQESSGNSSSNSGNDDNDDSDGGSGDEDDNGNNQGSGDNEDAAVSWRASAMKAKLVGLSLALGAWQMVY